LPSHIDGFDAVVRSGTEQYIAIGGHAAQIVGADRDQFVAVRAGGDLHHKSFVAGKEIEIVGIVVINVVESLGRTAHLPLVVGVIELTVGPHVALC